MTKNNGKIWTSAKANKFYSIRKELIRVIQKCTFIKFEPLCQKLWAFLSNFGIFYNAHSPNIVISRDPRCRFRFFLFFPNSKFNIRKSHKISNGKFSTSEVIRQNLTLVGTPLSAFRVKTFTFMGSRTITPRTITPRTITPGQLPPDNYPPRTNTPRTITPPQITEFPKHKSTKFTSHKVYKSQKVHKLRGQSHNIYEYKFYKIQVSRKVVHGYGKLWSFGGF